MSNPNFSISNEERNVSFTQRATLPIRYVGQTPVQRDGSVIFDPSDGLIYYSNGNMWVPIPTGGGGGGICITDADGDTSVCTDTSPETDSDTITFETSGTERARIDPAGVFMVGTTTPTAGKIAHFEGDVKITGNLDPISVQYESQASSPLVNTATQGLMYISNTNTGSYTNTPIYVDGANVSHVFGNVTGPAGPVIDDSIPRFDGTTGELLQSSNLILTDANLLTAMGDLEITSTGNTSLSITSPNYVDVTGLRHLEPMFVNTGGAVPTLLQSIPLDTPSKTYLVETRVTATDTATGNGASYMIESTYKRDGGTNVTSIGLPFIRESTEDANWKVNLTTAASSVDVFVTGVAATSINWNNTTTIQISQ